MLPPKCFSSLGSCACYFRLAKHLRSLPLLQLIIFLWMILHFNVVKFQRGLQLALALPSAHESFLGRYWLKQTEPWQVNKAAIRGGKKCSLQKFYPLFFWEKMCKLGDAESEQQKILLPLISLGEWGATGQTSVCSPGLLEGWCATLCLRHGNPPRSCKSDHLTCGVLLTKVCVKTNCLEKGVGANEVLLHLHLGGLRSLL